MFLVPAQPLILSKEGSYLLIFLYPMKPLISLVLSLIFAVTLIAQKEDATVETDQPPTLLRAEKPSTA
jgi:hypothetical protein